MNESPRPIQDESGQQLTAETEAPGVPQEYFSIAHRHFVTFTDTRLVSIAERWNDLPHTLRNKLVGLCLQASTEKP